jgi:hypothetical protein
VLVELLLQVICQQKLIKVVQMIFTPTKNTTWTDERPTSFGGKGKGYMDMFCCRRYEKKTLSTGFTGQLVVKRNFVFVIGFPYLSNVPGIFLFIKKNKK